VQGTPPPYDLRTQAEPSGDGTYPARHERTTHAPRPHETARAKGIRVQSYLGRMRSACGQSPRGNHAHFGARIPQPPHEVRSDSKSAHSYPRASQSSSVDGSGDEDVGAEIGHARSESGHIWRERSEGPEGVGASGSCSACARRESEPDGTGAAAPGTVVGAERAGTTPAATAGRTDATAARMNNVVRMMKEDAEEGN
jgi:hypothetical protein